MDTGLFIALINPGIALTFAATFLILWRYQKHHTHVLLLVWSFVAVAFGFLLQYVTIYDDRLSKLLSNLLILAGGSGLMIGVLARYGYRSAARIIVAIACAGFLAFAWFLYMHPGIAPRIYAINFTYGVLSLVVAAHIWRVRQRKPVDNILLGLMVFWGLSYFARPVAVIWIDGPYLDYAQYHQSLYWVTLTLASALFMLLVSLCMICAVALDVMEELRVKSQTDALSGLLNRRGFEDQSERELRRAQSGNLAMALVVCDLDHFKTINDSYGHAVGDEVIRTFADCLRIAAGPDHIVGRIGGEEFAILLKTANEGSARLFSEGVRTRFSALPIPGLPEDMRKTASFGVAQWVEGESVTELFIRADAALYEAKEAGRDRVRQSISQPDGIARRRANAAEKPG